MTHIIIPNISPVKFYGLRFLLFLLVIFLLWGSFELGYKRSLESSIASGEKAALKQAASDTQAQNNDTCETSKKFIHLEQQFLIAREACQIIKKNIDKDKQKIMQLEKELSFYKAIVAPAEDKDKEVVYLQSFEIVPYTVKKKEADKGTGKRAGKRESEDNKELLKKGNLYQYKFIVAQKVKKRTHTKGVVTIYIKGKQDNKEVKLSMLSLLYTKGQTDEKKIKSFKLGFKYFQEFSGIIQLPGNMQPQSVDIMMKIKAKNKNIKPKIELNDLIWSDEGKVNYVEQ